jgi:spermidine/putrescine transport system substrate-binding protein
MREIIGGSATGNGMSRREFVERSARLAVLVGVGGSLLSACGSGGGSSATPSIPLARLDQPVTLPDNGLTAVKSGLKPETGTLKILNYADYINPDTVKAFESAFGTKVEISTYDTEEKLLSNLRNKSFPIDLVIGATTLNLPKDVAGGLIQPINKDYLPNFTNVLPSLQSPYYDVGSKYTVPYTVYTTGVAYRRDVIDDSKFQGDDGWKLLWDPTYKGFVGLIDDMREVITLGMYYDGVTDTNSGDKAVIEKAEKNIDALVKATDARFDILAYQKIPEGTAHINQAWSGDMLTASQYLPEGVEADVLGYWKPTHTTVANDFFVVPGRSERPVLAHSLINYLLDSANAQENFSYVGYQPATVSPSVDDLIAAELVPEQLRTGLVTDQDVTNGYRLDALSPEVEKLWSDAYSRITAG